LVGPRMAAEQFLEARAAKKRCDWPRNLGSQVLVGLVKDRDVLMPSKVWKYLKTVRREPAGSG